MYKRQIIGSSSRSSSYILDVSGNTNITGTFRTTGAATFNSSVALGQTISVVSTNGILYHSTNNTFYIQGGSDGLILYSDGSRNNANMYLNNASQSFSVSTASVERMRILSTGTVNLNTSRGGSLLVLDSNLNTLTGIDIKDTGTTGGAYIYFQNSSGNQSGIITHSGTTSITYSSTSDYRLKENVKTIENGLNRVLSLKPVTYTWIDTDNEQGEGFLAHELQEVVPLAVVGKKDELKEDGTIKPQSIDNSRIVPILVKAIQELNEKLVRNNIN